MYKFAYLPYICYVRKKRVKCLMVIFRLKLMILGVLLVFAYANTCFALAPVSLLQQDSVEPLSVLEMYPKIKRSTDKTILIELISDLLINKDKHLVLERKEAKVKRIFMDWGGTLSDLDDAEMKALVKTLKKRGFSLSILTAGASPTLLCNSLKRAGVLKDFDQVIAVFDSTIRSETKEFFEDSNTEMVHCYPLNKISYLNKYVSDDETVVLIDNEAKNMSYSPNVIGLGVCGKTAKNVEGLTEPGTKWFEYAIADLTQVQVLDKIFDIIMPDDSTDAIIDSSAAVLTSV